MTADKRKTGANSSYKKLAVNWLNQALRPALSGFTAGRQLTTSKTASSASCKMLAVIVKDDNCTQKHITLKSIK